MKKVLVTGIAGYAGSVLAPKLLKNGYDVTGLDTMWFTSRGVDSVKDKITLIEGDIRDSGLVKRIMVGQDAVIHLANISNDPSSELNPQLTKEVNYESTISLLKLAKDAGVSRFIYASSGSVYGIKDFDNVTEESTLNPLTIYSKTKVWSEEVVSRANSKDFTTVSVRPGTHCGYSPRLRLDLITNILTANAITKGKMIVKGGNQKRPSIHLEDITNFYMHLLDSPQDLIGGEIFNANSQNLSILEIAQEVKDVVGGDVEIDVSPHPDARSYPMVSDKMQRVLGFKPKRTVRDAISDLASAFESKIIMDPKNPIYHNVEQMKILGIGKNE